MQCEKQGESREVTEANGKDDVIKSPHDSYPTRRPFRLSDGERSHHGRHEELKGRSEEMATCNSPTSRWWVAGLSLRDGVGPSSRTSFV